MCLQLFPRQSLKRGSAIGDRACVCAIPGVHSDWPRRGSRKSEPAISRVLSTTTIHLGQPSPTASSDLPGSPLGTGGAQRTSSPIGALCAAPLPYLVLLQAGFTVPRTVTSRAVRSYRTFSPLPGIAWRYIFCGTFHGLTPSRRYLAPCPKEPGLSSTTTSVTAIAWPTPTFLDGGFYTLDRRT